MKSRYSGDRLTRQKHNSTPLSQTRYEDLMRQMGQLFTQDEEGPNGKQQAIAEIQGLMTKYGLSIEDLE